MRCAKIFKFVWFYLCIKNVNNRVLYIDETNYYDDHNENDNDDDDDIHFENLNIAKVDISSMGSGSNYCPVYSYFKKNLILQNEISNKHYSMFSLSQLLYNVYKYNTLKKLCEQNDYCQKLLKKIYDGTYNDFQAIRISKYKNKYTVSDGNHRICVARRFGIESLQVKLKIIKTKNEKNKVAFNSFYRHNLKCQSENECKCKNIMDTYHNILETNCLSYADGDYLLSTNINDIDLVSFLETRKKS